MVKFSQTTKTLIGTGSRLRLHSLQTLPLNKEYAGCFNMRPPYYLNWLNSCLSIPPGACSHEHEHPLQRNRERGSSRRNWKTNPRFFIYGAKEIKIYSTNSQTVIVHLQAISPQKTLGVETMFIHLCAKPQGWRVLRGEHGVNSPPCNQGYQGQGLSEACSKNNGVSETLSLGIRIFRADPFFASSVASVALSCQVV